MLLKSGDPIHGLAEFEGDIENADPVEDAFADKHRARKTHRLRAGWAMQCRAGGGVYVGTDELLGEPIDAIHLRSRGETRQTRPEAGRRPQIVGIEERNAMPRCQSDAVVSRGADAPVRLVLVPYARAEPPGDEGSAAI